MCWDFHYVWRIIALWDEESTEWITAGYHTMSRSQQQSRDFFVPYSEKLCFKSNADSHLLTYIFQ